MVKPRTWHKHGVLARSAAREMLALRCVANGASLERAKRSLWSQADLQVPAVPRVQLLYGRTWISRGGFRRLASLLAFASEGLGSHTIAHAPAGRHLRDVFNLLGSGPGGTSRLGWLCVPPRVVRTLAIICDG